MTFYEFFALYALPVLLAGGGWLYAVLSRRPVREKHLHLPAHLSVVGYGEYGPIVAARQYGPPPAFSHVMTNPDGSWSYPSYDSKYLHG